jgi:hypothetical protein
MFASLYERRNFLVKIKGFEVLTVLLMIRFSWDDYLVDCYVGKAIPLQAWVGLEGFSRLRPPDFKTFGT